MSSTTYAKNSMTDGPIWKPLFAFVLPIILGSFFQQLYNTVDAMVVGRFVGADALGAVGGTTGTIINLMVNFFVGVSSGATVKIAQHFGAKEYDKVQNDLHSAFALSLILGAAIAVVGFLIAPWALRQMNTPGEIYSYALTYMRYLTLGAIAGFVYNMGSGILRAVGDTKRPLYFLIFTCILNILLDLFFVVNLKMGIAGAALATVLSQALSAVLVVITLRRNEGALHLDFRKIRIYKETKDIVRIGFPIGLQSDMYTISNMLIQATINSFGAVTVASQTAFGRIDSIFWMIMGALDVAVATFVGQNFGAKKFERIHKVVRVCLLLALIASVLVSAVVLLLRVPLLSLFTSDAAVLSVGVSTILIMVPFYFTYIPNTVFAGAIRGSGESLPPMLLTMFGICIFRIIWVYAILPLHREFSFLLTGYPVSWALSSLLFTIYYFKGGWLKRQQKKAGHLDPSPEEETLPTDLTE